MADEIAKEGNPQSGSGKEQKEAKKKAPAQRGEKEAKADEQQAGDGTADYKERMLRLAAEFDNYKKRSVAETAASKALGKMELLKKILPVLDEFELALGALGKGEENKTMAKGVEMVYSNMVDALKKEGLKELQADGVFDPYKHEIVMVMEGTGKPPGTIISVVKKGYVFGDVMLRPASVTIAKDGAPAGPVPAEKA